MAKTTQRAIQHVMARHNTARHGTVWHRTAQHRTARHGTARHGTSPCNTVQHGMVQQSTILQSTVRHGTARHGTARHSAAQLSCINAIQTCFWCFLCSDVFKKAIPLGRFAAVFLTFVASSLLHVSSWGPLFSFVFFLLVFLGFFI